MKDRPDSEPGSNLPLPFQGPSTQLAPRQPQHVFYPEDDESISLEHYLNVLLRRRLLLVAVVLTIVVLAALQVLTTTPMYTATARLQIDPEGAKIVPFQEVAGSEMAGGWFMEDYMWTQTENLRSHSLALRLVDKLDLTDDQIFNAKVNPGVLVTIKRALFKLARLPFALGGRGADSSQPTQADENSAAANSLMAGVTAQPIRNTRLIEVSYTGPDTEQAALVVNTLSEEFIEQHLEGKFNATNRATDFLGKQLEDLQIKVERSEQQLLDYAQRNNIVNLSERETIARKRLADLSDDLTEAQAEKIEFEARYDASRSASVDQFPASLKNEAIRSLEKRISETKSELAGYSSRYGPEWPAVKETRLEIQELESQIADERRRALTSARQDYELARDRHDKLETAVAEQRVRFDDLNERSIQYNILAREVESNQELYDGLLQRMKEAGVAAGLRTSNIRIADLAETPSTRSSPRRTRTLMLAAILGMFLGTGLIFLLEALDNTLKSSDDVTQHLGLPALGVVPSLDTIEGGSRKTRWPLSRNSSNGHPHLIYDEGTMPGARALEAYRSLRTALLLSHGEKPPQTMLVTSALPGEGKSTTVANTGIALAQTGARVLIVDLDMRKPSLGEAFSVNAEQGMSTFLSGNSDLSSQIHEAGLPNLFLVPAGPKAPNPAELIGSKRMATGMQLMEEYFNYVVIDSPPVLELSDALVISRYVDGVILVARGEKTPRKAVQKAGEHLLGVGAKLLGVLVNNVRLDHSGYGFYGSMGGYLDRYSPQTDKSQRSA